MARSGKTVKMDSSDHITYFYVSSVHVLWCLWTFRGVNKGLAIAALPWTSSLCSACLAVFTDTGALILCSNLRGRSFVSFVYNSMKCSSVRSTTASSVCRCIAGHCILRGYQGNSRPRKTHQLSNSVTDEPSSRSPTIIPVWKSVRSDISGP